MTAARREALLLTTALVVYSNGVAVLAMRRGRAADIAYRWTNPPFLLILVLALAGTRRATLRSTLRRAGLQREGWPQALAGGLALGLLLAGPPLLFFAHPLVLDAPLEYGRIRHLAPGAFWRRILLELSLGVALFEEIVFRGLLFDSWAQADGERVAQLASCATFAAWHFAVSVDTMRQTNLAAAATRVPAFIQRHANATGVAGGMLVTGVVGLLLSGLRGRARGNIGGPALAHWIADAAMVAALHRRQPR